MEATSGLSLTTSIHHTSNFHVMKPLIFFLILCEYPCHPTCRQTFVTRRCASDAATDSRCPGGHSAAAVVADYDSDYDNRYQKSEKTSGKSATAVCLSVASHNTHSYTFASCCSSAARFRSLCVCMPTTHADHFLPQHESLFFWITKASSDMKSESFCMRQ